MMSRQATLTKTNWKERARLFFESRAVEERPPSFTTVRFRANEKHVNKYPCPLPKCGGRMFLERELHTWALVMKCHACSRAFPIHEYERLSGKTVDIT